MLDRWNLDAMYLGFDDPAFAADLEQFKNDVSAFVSFTQSLSDAEPLAALKQGVIMQEGLISLGSDLIEFGLLRQAVDTTDSVAGSKIGQVMSIFSSTAGPMAVFQEWATALSNLMELIQQDEILSQYEFLFTNLKASSRFLLPGRGEEIMAKMSLSGGSAWAELQQYLTSVVPVSYRGETTNLSAIRNLAYDPDPQVRKDAYAAELACYERIADSVAYALNSIKLETLTDCELRGYAGPLDRTLKESHMSKETLDAMLGAMDEYLPVFHKYLRAKGAALGHENGLPWYDLFAPMGKDTGKFTPETSRDYLLNLFSGFDGELTEMVRRAHDENWIDFYPRSGKSGGAFCSEVFSLGQSRIMTNFDGGFGDVVTLAHELGHAFHNQCVQTHRPLNWEYSMPLAETASTFNECIIVGAALKEAGTKEEKLALMESQLQDVTQVICDIYSRCRCEIMVFDRRKDEFLNSESLCGLMTEAQKLSYGDGLDQSVMHPYMWVCKSHYYGPTFYNFPYAFGALFARGLYAQYEREGAAFVPKYKKLLYTTCIATAEDTAKVAGIDLTDKTFWRSALQIVADEIEQYCALVK